MKCKSLIIFKVLMNLKHHIRADMTPEAVFPWNGADSVTARSPQ